MYILSSNTTYITEFCTWLKIWLCTSNDNADKVLITVSENTIELKYLTDFMCILYEFKYCM